MDIALNYSFVYERLFTSVFCSSPALIKLSSPSDSLGFSFRFLVLRHTLSYDEHPHNFTYYFPLFV